MKRSALGLSLAAIVLPGCLTMPAESQSDQSIIGGQTAQSADFPTVVDLENGPGNWFCTGTLIDKDWVLTAAHCVAGETATSVKIRFDDNNINDTSGGRVVTVAEIHAHPGFVDTAWDNDIALIKLSQSVTDRTVTPVHRPVVAAATMVTEVGYGDSDNNGNGAGILRKLNVPTVDCAMANDPEISGANLLCFNASSGKSSCYGDSGGPAFVTVGGSLFVAGVTSGGTGNTCTQGWDLYTSVAGEIDFVDTTMGVTNPDPNPNPNPDPNPDPGNPGTGSDEPVGQGHTTGGGCSTGGGSSGGLLVVGLALAVVTGRRRRA